MNQPSRRLHPRLNEVLSDVPVIASVVGPRQLQAFVEAPTRVCILASFAIGQLPKLMPSLMRAGKFVFVNIDNTFGLSADRPGVDFLAELGVPGVVSTRSTLMERKGSDQMLTMQKIFVTDRSSVLRSVGSVSRSKPDLVELMPGPIVSQMQVDEVHAMSPFISAGFIRTPADIADAIDCGAVGIASSDSHLWSVTRAELARLRSNN